ncbi:MAG: class I SAM-dependent DNA methyltransferase [Candidatus Brevundimonas colombiensis]|uniref:site-specific DNA-methyltransferase (adenine-specific) n=1 Tax=Candidatus Brevundimonas colombiensis TaxID=3121376 RepID=A0AAJ5WUK7_9CAUL|nr:DNA methyltransferase [Brevundimonas sp.]WEK38531.1 MAG: class I SAM-dependent DNA methyltransferase [Brevundimonas sp.]
MNIDAFIAFWANTEGGAERANTAPYILGLLRALGLPPPDPAGATTLHNDYVFERAVRPSFHSGHPKRIDLYKRGCFLMEAKQSRLCGTSKLSPFGDLPNPSPLSHGPGWDTLIRNARAQAFAYVSMLPADHVAPPFVIICDVAHSFEVWADFSGTGRGYAPFPDRLGHRFTHADLARPEIQARLRAIWTDPHSLDPARIAAVVTREIADELSVISRRLEQQGVSAQDAAHFLMRCIFTIFIADVDLIPKPRLVEMLEGCVRSPARFAPMMEDMWTRFDQPARPKRFYSGFGDYLPHINGNLFADSRAFPLGAPEIRRLILAASKDWKDVEPAIFGSLLEHALEPTERRRLGAHYTPRRFVEHMVELTVMEVLRADWSQVQQSVEMACDEGDARGAVRLVKTFHQTLCRTRVLDPACGTGNFLYVALEQMKKLEGEVLQTLLDLGQSDTLALDTVDPHQFLGLELNPRAAAIADVVLWIGFLQQHYRNHTGHPSQPILKAHGNIRCTDAALDWDGAPAVVTGYHDGAPVQLWPNPRPATWPEAEFIVGNPPFIGGKDLRSRLDPGYAEALWAAHPRMNESADLVMYWWDQAADILTRPGATLRRFGFVTTNSITQVFQRRTVERWLDGPRPLSLIHAAPDHPWTKASRDSAAVRIAMTVVQAGRHDGTLLTRVSESALDTDEPVIELAVCSGRINADLTIGVDVTKALALKASSGLCSPGVKLHGSGFIVTKPLAISLGLGRRPGLERHIRPYRNGRDLTGRSRDAWVLDFFGLTADDLRLHFPEAYQHVVEQVKELRDDQGVLVGRDANRRACYRDNWWTFGEPRSDFRPAIEGLHRYIATVETAKHRVFQFLDAEILPDNKLIAFALDDAADLAILSSRTHTAWYLANAGKLGVYDRDAVYVKSRCFDPFPFPPRDETMRQRLREAGEALDAHRRAVLADHPDLTLTGLYNCLEQVRSGVPLDAKAEDVKQRGLILILRDLHDVVDRLTLGAYGWPDTLTEAQTVAHLVALNDERAAEERNGRVRWLRPAYQQPRSGLAPAQARSLSLVPLAAQTKRARPAFPKDRYEQPLAIQAALQTIGPVAPPELALRFSGGSRLEPRITRVLATLHRYGHVERLPDGRWITSRAA